MAQQQLAPALSWLVNAERGRWLTWQSLAFIA